MLASDSESVFSDADWIYEIKWDGYRAIADIGKENIQLYSRNGNTFNDSYPVIVDGLKKLGVNAVLDGEIVVLDENGIPGFQLLQHYESNQSHPIIYYAFDVLSINGTNTCDLPLIERKNLLKKLIGKNQVVKYSDHVEEIGEAFFEESKKQSLEGIMAKRKVSLYYPGTRTKNWLKIKHHQTQEAIIAGYTEPAGARRYFGALVLGVKEGKKLKYIGHTGSGFNHATLKELNSVLKPLKQTPSPFSEKVKTNMPVTWVKPQLVCEVKYTELTRDGHMRHPVFLRLRNDKQAKDVTMDAVKKVQKKKTERLSSQSGTQRQDLEKNDMEFGKIKVPLTNSDKLFWPAENITKGDVINYYQQMSKYILPYLKGRPQSLMRTPNGINQPGFYHKDAGENAPDWVESIPLFSESANKYIDYIVCNNKQTLAYLNNLGCIEINPWHSTVTALERPDYMVIDLDPSAKNSFEQVIDAALVVKEILDKAGALCFCKTSGATGLHIYIPLNKKYEYDQVKDFAQLICLLTHEQLPGFTSLERNLKKRGSSKIYLDHLQNRRGQTIASVYSLRPKPGATVSTPLLWKEVKKGLLPEDFNMRTVFKRIEKLGDVFAEVFGKGIDLQKCLKNLDQ